MARARNKWKAFSFKKLQLLVKEVENKVGANKVVSYLAQQLGQGTTTVRLYTSRRLVPNAAAQEKLNFVLNTLQQGKTQNTAVAPTKPISDKPANNTTPPNTSRDLMIPMSVLRKLVLKMPVTSKELDVVEALLTSAK